MKIFLFLWASLAVSCNSTKLTDSTDAKARYAYITAEKQRTFIHLQVMKWKDEAGSPGQKQWISQRFYIK